MGRAWASRYGLSSAVYNRRPSRSALPSVSSLPFGGLYSRRTLRSICLSLIRPMLAGANPARGSQSLLPDAARAAIDASAQRRRTSPGKRVCVHSRTIPVRTQLAGRQAALDTEKSANPMARLPSENMFMPKNNPSRMQRAPTSHLALVTGTVPASRPPSTAVRGNVFSVEARERRAECRPGIRAMARVRTKLVPPEPRFVEHIHAEGPEPAGWTAPVSSQNRRRRHQSWSKSQTRAPHVRTSF